MVVLVQCNHNKLHLIGNYRDGTDCEVPRHAMSIAGNISITKKQMNYKTITVRTIQCNYMSRNTQKCR